MADYSVNIAVAVKNSQAVTQLSGKIKETGLRVNQLNNLIENFADITGTTVVNSVKNFNKTLSDASSNLNNAALGTKAATEAARDFARAQDLANDALREQAELLARVRNEGRSGTLRGGTQYGGPIGPGPASATALRSPLPPSVPVALRSPMRPQSLLPQMGMTAQAGQIASDMEEVYASILRLTEKANREEAQKLQTLRQGTQEVEALAQKYRTVTDANKTQKQLQLEIRRGVIETKQQAAKEAEIASRDYLNRLQVVEKVGKERRDQMILADRELATERKINAVFERRARLEEQRQVQKRAAGSALIGGAFPLLFGQGIGASLGGAAGGFGGGMIGGEFGFGLSLVGTQLGTMFDQLVSKAGDLANSLSTTGDILSGLEDAGFKVSDATKSVIASYEEAGLLADAYSLAVAELNRVLGPDGVDKLYAYKTETEKLNDEFEKVSAALQAELIPALTGVVRLILGVKAAFDAFASTELGKGILKVTKAAATPLPGVGPAVGAFSALQQLGAPTGPAQKSEAQRLAEEEASMDKLIAQQALNKAAKEQGYLVAAQIDLARVGNDLLDKDVVAAKKKVIQETFLAEMRKEGITAQEMVLAGQKKELALTRLNRSVNDAERAQKEKERQAAERAARQAARAADRLAKKKQRAIERAIKGVDRELERTDKAFDRASSQLDAITQKHEDKMAFEREYSRLIQEGSTPAAAKQAIELKKQLLELDRQYTKLLEAVDAQILKTEASIADLKAQTGVTTEYEKQVKALEDLKKKRDELEGKKGKAKGAIEKDLAPETGRDKIEAEMERVQGALNDLIDPANQVILAAQAIGDAFSESFKGLITGSMSAQEALANLFSRTADHFADMAAQMIAKQIQMQVLGIALNFVSAAAGPRLGGGAGPGGYRIPEAAAPKTSGITFFNEGGYVSGPTRAVVGEGGESEYIIPESKMRESMARYSRGARGSSVIPETGGSGTSGEGGGVAVAAPIDVRYTVERINSVDYVTADQFQAGMRQAADQGAKQGEQRALLTLRQNTSQRRRIGI